MDTTTILTRLETERRSVADLLEQLRPDEWDARSLCPEWTVREVAAHLTLSTRTTLRGTLAGIVRARGDWNRMTATTARERATRYRPTELVEQIRATAGSARRAPGAGLLDPLVDVLVHGQDIARPLGRTRVMPTDAAIAALEHVRDSSFYGARRRFRGVTLVAIDADWTAGEGQDEIRGTLADLLLVATGRAAALTQSAV